MIVIVEGPDLAGKSTLIERLRMEHPWPVVKVRWTPDGDRRSETIGTANATIAMLRALAPDVIMDRCYFTRWAYDDDCSYLPELIALFDRVSATIPARFILLTLDEDDLLRRHHREPDHRNTLDAILRANRRYPSLLPLLPASLPALHINTTETSPDDVTRRVDAFLHHSPEG
jgi:thymidylate kinase